MSNGPIYLHVKPNAPLPSLWQSEAARVVLIAEVTASAELREEISRELVRGNCLYFMAWGCECEAWHDAVDVANIEQFKFKEIPDEHFVITTWHEGEPLSEVLWYCKNNVFHPTVEIKNTVLLHVAAEARAQDLLRQYAEA